MKKIEFIGAPSIGKSTLINEVIKFKNKNIILDSEVIINVAKEIKVNNFIKKILQMFLKINLFGKLSYKISMIIINTKLYDVYDEKQLKFNWYSKTFLKDISNKENHSFTFNLYKSSFYYNLLLNHMVIDYYYKNESKESFVIFDEGLIHNNDAFDEISNIEEYKTNNKLPSYIIYCYIDDFDQYLERRMNRINNGFILVNERSLDNEELILEFKESLESAKKKYKTMKKLGVPILKLNMNNDVKTNSKLMIDFLDL